MSTGNTEYVVINIPFFLDEEGYFTAKLNSEQFNTLNKFIVSHQRRLDCASRIMAQRSNSKSTKPKIRYQFVVVNLPVNPPDGSPSNVRLGSQTN
jgi:hypothetical protein